MNGTVPRARTDENWDLQVPILPINWLQSPCPPRALALFRLALTRVQPLPLGG